MTLQPKQPPQKPNQPLKKPPDPKRIAIWWLILIGLLIWNVFSFWPKSTPSVTLPYSTFLSQIRADNVAVVKITGAEISGSFVHPLTWPSPTSATPATPAATVTVKASPVATVTPATYTRFRTTFPATVGDPNLMPLLEAHNVEVKVSLPASPWFMTLLIDGLPLLLLVGFFVWMGQRGMRSEEHTSELQSHSFISYAVFCLKKKKHN